MKKTMLATAVAVALATPMIAGAEAIMYGQVRVATQNQTSNMDNVKSWGMQDQTSRLGVKGTEDLGSGFKAIYKMEFGVNVGNGFNSGSSATSQRNSYVGVSSKFGTLLMGRHDTPFKLSTGKLDFFADTNADFDAASLGSFTGTKGVGLFDSLRVSGAVAYISPSLAGLTFIGAVVQTDAGRSFENTTTPAAGNGDAVDPAGAYSLALTFNNGPIYASAAFESISAESLYGAPNAVPDYEKWRFGAGLLDFHNISLSATYEMRENTYNLGTGGVAGDTGAWQVQAAYDIMGMRIKGMYGEFDGDIAGNVVAIRRNFNTWALGMQHNLSKRTDIQVLYRKKDVENHITQATAADDDVFAVQIDHSF